MDKGVVFDGYCNMDKRDVVPLSNGDTNRKSWQTGGRNKHERRNREALEAQPVDLSAQ